MNKVIKLIKNEQIRKYFFILLALILIVAFCISETPVTLQNDTFYSIKIGELISTNGIDNLDHFSWHEGLPYTYPHWLYDLLTYFVYSVSGFDGIYLTTVVLTCILGISLYLVNSKLSKNHIIPFLTTIGTIYLLKGYITARAQLVTFTLFVFAIYFIEMFLKSKKIRYAIGLVLISTLIANLHCAVWLFLFVLFLPYIAEYFFAVIRDFINKKFRKNKTTKKEPYKILIVKNKATKWLILVLIACILVVFLTPIGTTPFTYLVKTMNGNTTENINEHLPMTLSGQTEIIVTICLFLLFLIFTKVKIRLCDLFMLCGLTYLMLFSKRQQTMFALIGSIILAKLAVNFITITFKGGIKGFNGFFTDAKTLVLLLVLTLSLTYYEGKDKLDDDIIDSSTYPVTACDYILENIDLSNAKFFNEYNYGSYMLFRGIPVFIDSRADLYSPEFNGLENDIFMDFIDTANIGKFYGDTFKNYGITHVILYKNAKVNMLIQKADKENYKEIYSDEHFVIYEFLNKTK